MNLNMKNLFKMILFVAFAAVLSSSTLIKSDETTSAPLACDGLQWFWLVKQGTSKPIEPGMRVHPSSTYTVHGTGGFNNAYVCVLPNPGYTINGSGCQDIGYDQTVTITSITTDANISGGINIPVKAYCTQSSGGGFVSTTYWFSD